MSNEEFDDYSDEKESGDWEENIAFTLKYTPAVVLGLISGMFSGAAIGWFVAVILFLIALLMSRLSKIFGIIIWIAMIAWGGISYANYDRNIIAALGKNTESVVGIVALYNSSRPEKKYFDRILYYKDFEFDYHDNWADALGGFKVSKQSCVENLWSVWVREGNAAGFNVLAGREAMGRAISRFVRSSGRKSNEMRWPTSKMTSEGIRVHSMWRGMPENIEVVLYCGHESAVPNYMKGHLGQTNAAGE